MGAGCSNVEGFSLLDKKGTQKQLTESDKRCYENNDYVLQEADANKMLRDEVFESLSRHGFGIVYEWGKDGDDYSISTLACNNSRGYTYSMYPTLKCGDVIIKRKISHINQISIGDLITFRKPYDRGSSVHRIIQHNGDSVITKGDNNKRADDFEVNMSMNIWIVVGVFHTGYHDLDRHRDDLTQHVSPRLKYTYDYS